MSVLKKVILFGGSFDPIHTGHIDVARHAKTATGADALIFIPARRSPHKTETPTAGHHRLAMIRKAIEGLDGFSVSDCELERPEPSYTLDTIAFFRGKFGKEAVLYWLIGADQLADFEKWYRVEDLLRACHISVMFRSGYPPPDFGRLEGFFSKDILEQLEKDCIQTPLIDLNSTAIRQQLAAGTLPAGALSPGVAEYIQKHGLYGCMK